VEDQPADSGDLTTRDESADAAETADDATGTTDIKSGRRRRRWSFLRRRSTGPAPVEQAPEPAVEPARVPVGKSARTARAQKPVDEPSPMTEELTDDSETAEAPAPEPVLVPHRPAGKRLTTAAVAAGVIFVAAAGFAGAMVQPYLADRAEVDIKLDVARTAASAITTLWTYTPDNMEALPDRSSGFLGGDFANEYRKYIDAIVASNKQAQVTNTTQVMGTAVESLSHDEATALVYTNSVATSPMTKNIPSLRYLSYRLTMQRHDAKWLITRMTTVTSFDLTPQL
jgi:Mce-associated membrane protein